MQCPKLKVHLVSAQNKGLISDTGMCLVFEIEGAPCTRYAYFVCRVHRFQAGAQVY